VWYNSETTQKTADCLSANWAAHWKELGKAYEALIGELCAEHDAPREWGSLEALHDAWELWISGPDDEQEDELSVLFQLQFFIDGEQAIPTWDIGTFGTTAFDDGVVDGQISF
jgi:hypothetical protein